MSLVSDIFAGGVEGVLTSLTKAVQVFKADATQQAQLDAALEQAKITLVTLGVQADMAAQKAVNDAMQAESKSEHFLQYSWRPLAAYMFYGITGFNYIVAPVIHLPIITIPESVFFAYMAILGVTAWHRGVMQVEQVKGQTNGNGRA